MQSTSELYKTLIADPGHVKECRLIVAGEEYASDRIVSMETDGGLFEQDTVCVGSAVSRQLEVVLYGAGEIPKGAKLIPEYRIRLGDQVSEWKRKGVYYIDTREPRAALGTLTIHAFDDFMNMEAEWVPSQDLEFPMPMDRAATEIARYYGITIDSRSRLRSDYFIDYPTPGTSGRTIFKWIAAAHGGNWTMTDNGEARLVRLRDLDSETGSLVTERGRVILIGGVPILVGKTAEKAYDGPSSKVFVGPNAADVSAPPTLNPISKIVILVDDDNYFEAGDDSGLTLEITCPYGTQAMANDLINELRGYRHVPLEAQDTLIDPAAEIGDGVTVNGVYTILASMATTFDSLMSSDIGAPGQRETESEIGRYYGPMIKSFNRSIARTRSYITKTAEQIRLEVSNEVERLTASFDVKLGEIRGEITDAVNGLSASVDVKLGNIHTELTDDINDLSADVTLKYNELTASLSSGLDGLSADFALKLTGLETSFRDDQEKQSAAFDVKLDGLSATFSDEQTKQEAAFDVKLEGLSATFSDELEGLSSEFSTGLSGLTSHVESNEKGISQLTQDVGGFQASVDGLNGQFADFQLAVDGISSDVKGLGGRVSTVEQTASTLTTKVNGLDGRTTTLEQTASGLTTDVSDLSGKYTSLNQTVSGVSSTVSGLSGQFTTLEQTVNGFTFKDAQGKVWINNGNINLTGAITWGDLNSTVQSEISNRGISESRAHTLISDDLVDSPTIRGANIYGGAYHDTNGRVDMTLDAYSNGGVYSAGLTLRSSGGTTIFKINPNLGLQREGGSIVYTGAQLYLGDYNALALEKSLLVGNSNVLFVGRDTNIDRVQFSNPAQFMGKVTFDSTVDFTYATVIGLKIA